MNVSPVDDAEQTLAVLSALQEGLALVPRPYDELANRAGVTARQARLIIAGLLEDGVIKRLGVVVRHHELGFVANAMVVFDIADEEVDALGERLASRPEVTLCYRRARHPPQWPYNLFCMVHGQDRDAVREQITALRDQTAGLRERPFAVLFSSERFKQCGARRVRATAVSETADV